ncbi:universal stress protein [Ornithinimicrobium sp. F0845]|uniref:universal stress protein n=1 Tax=Ornithinimicrobium sp. F0845 TaxID=2926412 RepID=UPI001FF5FA0C|nr:universal stress protein [Ornithinimicrobium sp. F0845]MCK0112003.1 universal stress protein [Ornithinimicrobium sp. F0845]
MVNEVIVVGLDGSDRSHDALRFALEEARLRDAAVEVITTWREDSQGDTREQAEEVQAVARGQIPADGAPPVDFQIVHGRPQEALVNASARASLLVIGAHGVQSIRRAALGSISEYVARLASCPVVVIPAGAAPRTTG